MSRKRRAKIESAIITKVEDIKGFVANFDFDLSGANGKNCISSKALMEGFSSDIDSTIADAKALYASLGEMLGYIMYEIKDSDDDYVDTQVIDLKDGRFVVILARLLD